jgi:7SK snRNA methylphosphate capping enzyme
MPCKPAQSGARKVVGVDIDETLIRGAWKRRRTVWSTQEPTKSNLEPLRAEPPTKKQRVKGPFDSSSSDNLEPDYFPSSCEHIFGPLPIPLKTNPDVFPHNVVFHTADWVNTEIAEDAEGYDVVVA